MERVIDGRKKLQTLITEYDTAASDVIGELEWANLTKVEMVKTLLVALVLVSKEFDDPQQVIDEVVDALVEGNDGE